MIRIPGTHHRLYRLLQAREHPKPWLHLGCGFNHIKGAVNADINPECQPELCFNMLHKPWPIESESMGYVCSVSTFEHLPQILPVIGEVWRVLRMGGRFEFTVPYWLNSASYEDPTHCRFFGRRSACYYQAATYSKNTGWYSDDRFNFEIEESQLIEDTASKSVQDLWFEGVCKEDSASSRWLRYMVLVGTMPGVFRYVIYRLTKAPLPEPEEPVICELDLGGER